MKHITILMFFILLLCGCKKTYRTHILKNESRYSLIINGYRVGGDGISSAIAEQIHMEPNSELVFERYDGEGHDARTFFSISFVDSTNIIFESKKILSLRCNQKVGSETCHPILEGAPIVVITEEDYNRAVPIEN